YATLPTRILSFIILLPPHRLALRSFPTRRSSDLVVGNGFPVRFGLLGQHSSQLGIPLATAVLPSPGVDRPSFRHSGQPRTGVAGHTLAWPLLERGQNGCAGEVLGERHVPGDPGERGDHRGALDPPDGSEPLGDLLAHYGAVCARRSACSARQPFSFCTYSWSA